MPAFNTHIFDKLKFFPMKSKPYSEYHATISLLLTRDSPVHLGSSSSSSGGRETLVNKKFMGACSSEQGIRKKGAF